MRGPKGRFCNPYSAILAFVLYTRSDSISNPILFLSSSLSMPSPLINDSIFLLRSSLLSHLPNEHFTEHETTPKPLWFPSKKRSIPRPSPCIRASIPTWTRTRPFSTTKSWATRKWNPFSRAKMSRTFSCAESPMTSVSVSPKVFDFTRVSVSLYKFAWASGLEILKLWVF